MGGGWSVQPAEQFDPIAGGCVEHGFADMNDYGATDGNITGDTLDQVSLDQQTRLGQLAKPADLSALRGPHGRGGDERRGQAGRRRFGSAVTDDVVFRPAAECPVVKHRSQN